jgi:hypothetical protein
MDFRGDASVEIVIFWRGGVEEKKAWLIATAIVTPGKRKLSKQYIRSAE